MKLSSNDKGLDTDVLLIGAGIMSATLGALLKLLDPGLRIEIIERLDKPAAESSDAWNNAGTGHTAFCELNYTPERGDGTIDTKKAVNIAEAFELSRQFWSYLVETNFLSLPQGFIREVPHISFVWGKENVEFLRKRYEALSQHPLFSQMEFSDDPDVIRSWVPLIMQGRDTNEHVAATRVIEGTDVDFGSLTKGLLDKLTSMPGVGLHLNEEITDLNRRADNSWQVDIKVKPSGMVRRITSRFVFIGAGGGSLPLLLKSGISERKGLGGFPVSGQWLVCTNPDVIEKHKAKVYGKAEVGAPPMSVPHLDTRVIGGERSLLFGPYAGFSTKFLKQGSFWDLLMSLRFSNIIPMIGAGLTNIPLTKYLISEVLKSPKQRFKSLQQYYPEAKIEDWKLEVAGQRVQIIKADKNKGGKLEFGTEIVNASDGSLAALLGASPGASTSVAIMLDLLKTCFEESFQSEDWQSTLKKLIPSFGTDLDNAPEKLEGIRAWTNTALKLQLHEEGEMEVS